MNCEELSQLIPDLVDGTVPASLLAEVAATLPQCPDSQRELAIAQQVRTLLIELQAEYVNLRLPIGFEARVLAQIKNEHSGLELLDLSSRIFGLWLVELTNLIGGLFDPGSLLRGNPQPGKA